jgi:hypothetical protein
MKSLQEIFTNREIAIGSWVLLGVIIAIFTKPAQQFIKTTIPIIFCRKFVMFYIIFLSFFSLIIYCLYWIGFWDVSLLKGTIFWVVFVELPLFVRTIEKAKDNHFFIKLIKDNIALIVVIEFFINFLTFGLVEEFVLVPCALFIGLLYAIAAREKKYQKVKHFFDVLIIIFGFVVIIHTVISIFQAPEQIFNIATLKEFLLPTLLLLFNLPIVYGLALYNTYEQLFIRVKGTQKEKNKMKRRLLLFASVKLSKATAIRNNLAETLVISLTENDLDQNLKRLKNQLSMYIGDNYMKRAHFYSISCIIGLIISIIGLIFSNSQVSLKDIISFNFTLDIIRIKEILTFICSTGLVFCICLLVLSIGLSKKKYEEISQVKKFALHELLFLLKRQYAMIKEYPPLDNPLELFSSYMTTAYEIKMICDKSIHAYGNLLKRWEKESIEQLQTYTTALICDLGIDTMIIAQYDAKSFNQYFADKTASAPQNDKVNVYTTTLQRGFSKYSEQLKLCYEEFKHYM